MPALTCLPSLKGAHGVRVRLSLVLALLTLATTCFANKEPFTPLEAGFCTFGSHIELYAFFSERNYIVVAQAKRMQDSGKTKDFADVLFLVSPNMEYSHVVILNGIKHDHFKACIHSSSREIDYQFASPIPDLLIRKNREHLVFLSGDIPKDASCISNDNSCTPWSDWSATLKQAFLFSAYAYSPSWENDPYKDVVELTLDDKVIRPMRGVFTEYVRKKYALRLRNDLKESNKDQKAAKLAYKQIHDEVDHKLALVLLNINENRDWSLSQINRKKGFVKTFIHGVELELYPMQNSAYKRFLQKKID